MQGGLTKWLRFGEDGRPLLGWHDTLAYLVLPLLLVGSQYLTQRALQPQHSQQDGAIKTSNSMVPLMIGEGVPGRVRRGSWGCYIMMSRLCDLNTHISLSLSSSTYISSGWFALSVPSGMGLYWLTNNALSAAQQLHFRRRFQAEAAARASADTGVEQQEPVEEKRAPMQSQQQGERVREGAGARRGGRVPVTVSRASRRCHTCTLASTPQTSQRLRRRGAAASGRCGSARRSAGAAGRVAWPWTPGNTSQTPRPRHPVASTSARFEGACG